MARRDYGALATTVALSLAVALPASAGPPRPATRVDCRFDRQDLAEALVALAVRSGRNIVFRAETVAGRTSQPVIGACTVEAAVTAMLAGSDLTADVQGDGSILIRRAPRAPLARGLRLAPRSPGPETTTASATLVSEVVVTMRSAQAEATSFQSAVTSEDIADAPDTNVAEAAARAPGVTVLDGGPGPTNSVPVDLQGRGRGEYLAVRGLDAEFNVVQIDGVDVAQSQPYSRGVQLDLLPPAGLQKVVIEKTLSADMDGDAIGGVIDVRTSSAFDFADPFYAALSLGGRYEDRAAAYGRDPLGQSGAGELAARFGDHEQFGVHLGGYVDQERFDNTIIDGIYPAEDNKQFAYAVANAQGQSAPGLDPARNLVLTGLDVGMTIGETRRYGGDFSFDWRPLNGLSGYVRVTYARSDTSQQTYYAQIYGDDVGSAPIGETGRYAPVIANVQPRYYYETDPERANLGSAQVGGEARSGALRVASSLFFSWGENDDPDHFEISAREPEVAPGLPFGGSSLFGYSNGVPIPRLDAADMAAINDIAAYGARYAGELTQEFSRQIKYGAKTDLTWSVQDGLLQSVSAGFKYENSLRDHTVRDYTGTQLYTTDANDPPFGSLGFLSGSVKSLAPGYFTLPAPTISQKAVLTYFYSNIRANFGGLAGASDECNAKLLINADNCDSQNGGEAVTALYAQARFQQGSFEVVAGLRYEHTGIVNQFWTLPEAANGAALPGYFSTTHTSYDELLPRVVASYRPDAHAVYRAAVWSSYSRPDLFQLGGGAQIAHVDGGASAGGVTTVTEGNPQLKAVQALNFDFSGSWSSAKGDTLEAALFYKALENYVFDSIDSFSNATSAVVDGVVVVQPKNGGAGRVFGLELSERHTLSLLPGPLAGLVLSGNLTLEHSQVHTNIPGLDGTERLLNAPDVDANAQLSYQLGRLGLHLSDRYIGAYVSQYGTLGASSALDTWVHANQRLDWEMDYQTRRGVRISFSVTNLLGDPSYYATVGHTGTIPSLVQSGRTFLLQTKVPL